MPSVSSPPRRSLLGISSCALIASLACNRAPEPAADKPTAPAAAPAAPVAAREPVQPAPAAPPEQAIIPCSVAPAAMVSEVLQLPKLELTAEKIEGKSTLCEYKPTDAERFVSIRFERGYTVDKFEGSKEAFTNPVDIPGIGERAFTASLPMLGKNTPYGINSIAVLKNHTHLTVSAPVNPDLVLYLARDLLHEI